MSLIDEGIGSSKLIFRWCTVKVMVISDLHYDRHIFHGIDESKAWKRLLFIVDYHRPDLLISLGD